MLTRSLSGVLVAAALSCAVGCAVDKSGLTINNVTGGEGGGSNGDATVISTGGKGGDNLGLGGQGVGGMLGTGGDDHQGAGGKGLGGTGMGGTASGGTGAGGTGAGGTGTGGGATGGKAVGGMGMGGHVVDAGPDVRDVGGGDTGVDVPVDAGPDVPPCDFAHGMHRCDDTCVSNSSLATCGPTSCSACPVPANASATCDGATCGFNCNVGFMPVGAACVPSCDANCGAKVIPVAMPGGRFTGTTSGTSLNAGSCGGGSAPEAVYQLTLIGPADVFVTTHGTKFDTVVYMRRAGCCGDEIACNDNADGRNTSVINATALPTGIYDIFVDGAGSAGGAYTVDIYTAHTSTKPGDSCGNPMRIANMPIVGDTCGGRDDDFPVNPTCGTDNAGIDMVFYFVLDAPTMVTFDTCSGTCLDTSLYFREICNADTTMSEVACNNNACGGQPANPDSCFQNAVQSKVQAQLSAGPHYIVVDTAFNDPGCGLFTLNPTNVPP